MHGDVLLQGQDDARGTVSINFDWRTGRGSTLYSAPEPPAEQVKLETNDARLLDDSKAAALATAGTLDQRLSSIKWSCDGDSPRLSFLVNHGKKLRTVTYELRSGLVSFGPGLRSMRLPDFLTSLHLSHGYPRDHKLEKLRSVRAVFVDAMAVLMCFWALSGVAMWLQLKRLRRSGILVGVVSLLATGIVWSGMYRIFTRG